MKNSCLIASMSYPQPTGPYKTGKVAYDWADQGRPEIATGNATSRELMVYVWYPADVSANMAEAPVMDARIAGAVRPGDAFSLGFLKDFSDHTYKDLPLSANRSQYPVLIMSHSDTSSPLLMAVTAADMASHGYIVVGISHTYNARGTVFPDGRVITRDYNYSLIGDDYINFSLSYYENAKQWARHNAEVEGREADDVSFVMDRLEQLNKTDSLFKGKIDMNRMARSDIRWAARPRSPVRSWTVVSRPLPTWTGRSTMTRTSRNPPCCWSGGPG